ncbi:hypothetical protein [Natronoglycomyces albus]|uniref:DUF308 domain-containing protein n=1 Tax=Natronoglycomyces albus TaxID=2811108 RepID=A0A895XRH9_9ACTN|nr:hypothetical protein [Natronoglycomyces albus]QSB06312.1 hypothetical protein JQS30_05225 [Natronoglycomyces albus]
MTERNDTGPGQGGAHSFGEESDPDEHHQREQPDDADAPFDGDTTPAPAPESGAGHEPVDDSFEASAESHGGDLPDSNEDEANRELPSGSAEDPDDWQRRFDELVADLDPPPEEISYATGGPPPQAPPDPRNEPTLLEKWDAELPEDDDEAEEYIPPPPPPLPWPSLPGVAGFLCVLTGILVFVRPDWMPFGTNGGRLIGFVVFVTGAALLISRLREDPEEDERPDDGAVV